jgi:DNA-binding response OmpR family regulator
MQIIYLEREKFLARMVEMALEKSGVKVYFTDQIDIFYLLDDLRPDLLLINLEIWNDPAFDQEKLTKSEAYGQICRVALGQPQDIAAASTENIFHGYLTKPLSPTDLFQKLSSFLAQNRK